MCEYFYQIPSMITLLKLLKPYHNRFVEIHLYSRDGGDLWSDRWEEGHYNEYSNPLCAKQD